MAERRRRVQCRAVVCRYTVSGVASTSTGKTFLARMIARECGLPLIKSSVAELFAISVGYLDSVVKAQRSLFARAAAAAAPCVLFLDEIADAGNLICINTRTPPSLK